MAKYEVRALPAAVSEITEEGKLTGRAAPFNKVTMIGRAPWGFREKIEPGAFTKTLNDGDVVLLDNHDSAKPLARMSKGTLELREGDGLDWSAVKPTTTYGLDCVENVRTGNYGGCSFGFEVVTDEWTTGEDGIDERTLKEIKLHEISLCTFPAYGDTNVSLRDVVETALEARDKFYEKKGLKPPQRKATLQQQGLGLLENDDATGEDDAVTPLGAALMCPHCGGDLNVSSEGTDADGDDKANETSMGRSRETTSTEDESEAARIIRHKHRAAMLRREQADATIRNNQGR